LDKKKIYEALEAVDGNEKTIETLKEYFKAVDNTEAELRTIKSKFEAVGNRDIAKMVQSYDLLQEKGIKDSDSLVDIIGKGEMSETEMAKLKSEQAQKLDALNGDYQKRESEYQSAQMRDRITFSMLESCHGDSKVAESIAKLATLEGHVFRGDDGEIMLKNGSESLKFSESTTKLAERYQYMIPKPLTGSGVTTENHNSGSAVVSDWASAMTA